MELLSKIIVLAVIDEALQFKLVVDYRQLEYVGDALERVDCH